MGLRIAFQMEPMEQTTRDTHTLALMDEACKRGHQLYHYVPSQLSLKNGKVIARVREVSVNVTEPEYYHYGAETILDLQGLDVILIRQDPPFNMEYITTTYLLERIHPQTLVVNDPRKVRDFPEKLYPFDFQEFMPPTLVTSDPQMLQDFREEYQDIVVKPLYDYHGNGVFHVTPEDENFDGYVELLRRNSEQLIAQRYIPEIKQGNKRVIFVDGEIAGSLITVPGEKEFRIYRNSTDLKYELNDRDKEICKAVGAACKREGLLFTGIDIIGDYLTEINVTSVGSIWRINKLYGIKVESTIWDAIERAREKQNAG